MFGRSARANRPRARRPRLKRKDFKTWYIYLVRRIMQSATNRRILHARTYSSIPHPPLFITMNFSLCLDGLCLLLLASVGISSAVVSSSSDTVALGHMVSTTSGRLIGHPSVKKPAVLEFLGIPYAHPPVGDLRFAPPRSYSSRETFTASNYVCCPKDISVRPSLSEMLMCGVFSALPLVGVS
jgi:hypothetical protein